MPVDKITPDDSRVSHREAVLNGRKYRTCLPLERAFIYLMSRRLHTWCPEAWKVQGYHLSHSRMAGFIIWLAISDTVSHPAKHAGRGSGYDGIR